MPCERGTEHPLGGRTRWVAAAGEVPDEHWSPLADARSVYATKLWYQATEHHSGLRPRYVTVYDGPDRLRGLARVFHVIQPYSQFYDPAHVFPEVLGKGSTAQWRPYLSLGSRMSTNELLIAPGVESAERRAVVAQLASAVRERAIEYGVPVASMYMPELDAELLREALGPGAMCLRSGRGGEIRVGWETFEGYLASLSTDRRQAVRREIRRFDQAGHMVVISRLSDVWPEISKLITNVDRKYGIAIGPEQRNAELEQQARLLGPGSVVFVCRDSSGAPIAASVLFHHGDGLFARHVGIDYDRAHSFEYFNLLFYRPIEYAIAEGVRRIHYGLSTAAKIARGVRTTTMCSVIWRPDWPTRRIADRAAAWNARDHSIGLR